MSSLSDPQKKKEQLWSSGESSLGRGQEPLDDNSLSGFKTALPSSKKRKGEELVQAGEEEKGEGGRDNEGEEGKEKGGGEWDSQQLKKGMKTVVLGLISIVFLFWLASAVIPRVLVYLTRAANRPGQYSLSNSYIFGSPLLAAANGEEKIRVSVFLLDAKGRGVPNKTIELRATAKQGGGMPQIKAVQPTTDNFGKAVFEVVSTFSGQFVITAVVDGLELPQPVTLTFR